MTLERMIRRKAQELQARTLRERLGSIAGPLAVAACAAFGISMGSHPVPLAVFAAAMAWSLVGVYLLNRGAWPARLAGDAALATGLEFCRKEIECGLHYQRRFLMWVFAPIVVSIGAFVVPAVQLAVKEHVKLTNMIPFPSLIVLWVIGMFVIRNAQWNKLRREIDELNEIEGENR